MGFTGVYKCLQEIFPQIDDRLLRAVAIENPKDPDEAVATIINEIVPVWSERSKPPVSSPSKSITEDGTRLPGDQMWKKEVDFKSYSMSHFVASVNAIDRLNYSAVYNDVSDDQELPSLDIGEDSYLVTGSSKMFHGESSRFKQNFDASTAEEHDLFTLKNVQECDRSALDVSSLVLPPQVDGGFLPNSEKQLVLDKGSDFIMSVDGTSSSKHDFSGKGQIDLESDSETDLVSQSSKVIKIDQLEEMINEAKTNKKMLFSSMEPLMNLMKEAELKEKAAEEAKMEAAMAGSDTLVRVEELKEMLAHAKLANEMYAGEIYGEKAIFATEMRELQSRLSSLSEGRDRSLAILDEMCQSLEARLAAAEEMSNKAEKEIQIKEEIAQNALAKQESIMETVVQESNRLHQEAEENAKLRDFLIDRGHLVDMLQ